MRRIIWWNWFGSRFDVYAAATTTAADAAYAAADVAVVVDDDNATIIEQWNVL